MSKICYIIMPFLCMLSCKMQTGSTKGNGAGDKILKLALLPQIGISYVYIITNESKTDLQVNEKETELIKKYTTEIKYIINKDAAGNYLLSLAYNKIHIYSKTGETETDLDASNAELSGDRVEKIVGALQSAKLVAVVSPAGEAFSLKGHQEIADNILAAIKTNDIVFYSSNGL